MLETVQFEMYCSCTTCNLSGSSVKFDTSSGLAGSHGSAKLTTRVKQVQEQEGTNNSFYMIQVKMCQYSYLYPYLFCENDFVMIFCRKEKHVSNQATLG